MGFPGPVLGVFGAAGPAAHILALIEVISYFVRPVSHSIRLAGNMMAGHAVIKVFAGFAAIAAISPLSIRGDHRHVRAGNSRKWYPSLRVRNSDLRVSERCAASFAH